MKGGSAARWQKAMDKVVEEKGPRPPQGLGAKLVQVTREAQNQAAKKKAYMERDEREFHQKVTEGERGDKYDAEMRKFRKEVVETLVSFGIDEKKRDEAQKSIQEITKKANEVVILLCFDVNRNDLLEGADSKRKYGNLVQVNREAQAKHIKEVNQLRELVGRKPDLHNSGMSADDVMLYEGINSLDEEMKGMCLEVINERVRQILQKPNKALAEIIKLMITESGVPDSWSDFLDPSLFDKLKGASKKGGAGGSDGSGPGGRGSTWTDGAGGAADGAGRVDNERLIAKLKSDLLEAVAQRDELQARLRELEGEGGVNSSPEARAAQAQKLERERQAQAGQLEATKKLAAQLEKLQTELKEERKAKEAAEAEMKAMRARLEELEEHHADCFKQRERKDKEVARMKKECEKLRAEYKKMEEELNAANELLKRLRAMSDRRASQGRSSLLGADGARLSQLGIGSGKDGSGQGKGKRGKKGSGFDQDLSDAERRKKLKDPEYQKRKLMKRLLRVLREQHRLEESSLKPGEDPPIESDAVLGHDGEKTCAAAAVIALLEKVSPYDEAVSSSSSEDLEPPKRELVQYRKPKGESYHGPLIHEGVLDCASWKMMVPDSLPYVQPGSSPQGVPRLARSSSDLGPSTNSMQISPTQSPALRNLKKGTYSKASSMKAFFDNPFDQMLQHSNLSKTTGNNQPMDLSCIHGSGIDTCPTCSSVVPKLSLGWCLPPLGNPGSNGIAASTSQVDLQ